MRPACLKPLENLLTLLTEPFGRFCRHVVIIDINIHSIRVNYRCKYLIRFLTIFFFCRRSSSLVTLNLV